VHQGMSEGIAMRRLVVEDGTVGKAAEMRVEEEPELEGEEGWQALQILQQVAQGRVRERTEADEGSGASREPPLVLLEMLKSE